MKQGCYTTKCKETTVPTVLVIVPIKHAGGRVHAFVVIFSTVFIEIRQRQMYKAGKNVGRGDSCSISSRGQNRRW